MCASILNVYIYICNSVAPGIMVRGQPVQEFLQSHYISAVLEIAKVVADMDHVVGFGTMNEPSPGYIGVVNLSQHFFSREFKEGYAPTPFQGMCLADGHDVPIEVWSRGHDIYIYILLELSIDVSRDRYI